MATRISKSRRNATPAIFGPGGDGDPKKTFGSFLLAIIRKDTRALEEMGSRFVEWDEADAGKKIVVKPGTEIDLVIFGSEEGRGDDPEFNIVCRAKVIRIDPGFAGKRPPGFGVTIEPIAQMPRLVRIAGSLTT